MDKRARLGYSLHMKVQLIYNPAAGFRDVTNDLDKVIRFLESRGWEVTLRETLGRGDAVTYAREAVANDFDMAVAVGGDGTLGEVASGLAWSDCALGVLPVGTGNVWAHMLGLPTWTPMHRSAIMDAARVLVEGESRRIDLGRAGDRYFALWAGVGFDAQIIHDVEPQRETRPTLRNLTYYVTAISLCLGLRGTRVTVAVDDQIVRQRVILILVSNAQLYGRSWRVAPEAQLDDGLLDVYIFKGGGTLDALRHFSLILLGKHTGHPEIETYRARRVEIRAEKPLPLHMDGDPAGHTPVTITVAPRALSIVVPPWASSSLFQGRGGDGREELSLAQRIAARLRYERERLRGEGERFRDDWSRRLHFPHSD